MAEGEFEFIARRLRPLATAPGALGLVDDAALLDPRPGMQLVLTKDAMVAGVHFLADDPAGQIAQKLLRVNLSDLAAMGAAPIGYLLALAHAFLSSDEAGFVNAVLDRLAGELRPETRTPPQPA